MHRLSLVVGVAALLVVGSFAVGCSTTATPTAPG